MPTLFVSTRASGYAGCRLNIFVAEFAFGEEIGAVQSWSRGEALDMIAVNDEKSKTIALV